MAITKEQVQYVAHLARINLDKATLDQFTSQLDSILNYMEQLNALDTRDAAATTHVVNLENVFRPDVPRPSLSPEAVLQNAPDQENNSFKVPKVI